MLFLVARGKRLTAFKSLLKSTRINHTKGIQRSYLSVPKDINIYKNESAGFARIIGICSLGQWLVVTYMSTVMYQNMPSFFSWIPVENSSDQDNSDGEKSQRLVLAEWKYRVGFSAFTFAAACALVITSCMYCFRTVSSITLLKNSEKVLITTYTPLGTTRNVIASIRNVSAIQSRSANMTQVPLKVKDHHFYFLVDKSGKFTQPTLFDRTVGIKRDFGISKK